MVRLHLAILAGICFFYIATGTSGPEAAFSVEDPERWALASLEDQFATHPDDPVVAASLLEAYLDRGRPGLAVAVIRAGEAHLLDHPTVAHRLASAYEQSGRPLEALATAKVARARCARTLGSREASALTPVPAYGCSEGTYAALNAHVEALDRMVKWGVVFPSTDPRREQAYQMAIRRASIAAHR